MSAFVWALLTALIWGIVPVIEKLGLARSDPTIGVFARCIGVMIGFAVFGLLWSPWQALGQLSVRSFCLLALGGLLASVVGQLAFYQALKTSHVSWATPIAGTYPLIAAALGWWVLREPLTGARLLAVVLIVCGVVLLRR